MSRRLAVAAFGVLAVLGTMLVAPRGAGADDGDQARTMLERSREAAADQDFEGTVRIEWVDRGHRNQRDVAVEMSDGVLHMGNDRLVSSGTRRLLRTDAGWQLLWAGRASGAEPDPTRKYRFVITNAVSVAGRPATQVAIGRSGSHPVRERLFFDDATGMMLRRDQLDANGKLVRRFAFVKLSEPRPVGTGPSDHLPKVSSDAPEAAPHAMKDVPDDLRAPKQVGNGFKLVGLYSQPDGTVQLYYSDGLLGLSVFERDGELDWGALPTGGRTAHLGDVRARVYRTAAGTAVVWGNDDVTYTSVTDAPLDEVAAVTADFSDAGDGGVLEDVGRFVTAPFTWG